MSGARSKNKDTHEKCRDGTCRMTDWGGNATVTVNWDSPYFVDYRNERAP